LENLKKTRTRLRKGCGVENLIFIILNNPVKGWNSSENLKEGAI
jgi:hypothetical protein